MKKTMVFLLSLTIAFMPSLVFAAGGLAPWSITNTVAQGASTILTGSKEVILNGAKKIATGTAKITPTASQVSKVLARGAAGYALSVAVQQLIGAVDWVLDPANNQITWSEKIEVPVGSAYWITQINEAQSTVSALDSCTKYMKHNAKYISYGSGLTYVNPRASYYNQTQTQKLFWCEYDILKNGVLQSTQKVSGQLIGQSTVEEKDKKTMPLEVVAQKVIDNAESSTNNDHKVGAQVATTTAAADIINEAENDNVKARPIVQQLENTQSIPTDQTANGDAVPKENANTENPSSSVAAPEMDLTLDFPIFCDWAPSVCQAAKVVITKPQEWADSVSTAYTDAVDWFKKEPDKDVKEQVDIVTPEAFDTSIFTKDRFQVSRQCPVPEQHTITLSGVSVNFSFDMTPLCRVLELARPALVACSYLYAGYIIIGAARNG